MPAYITRRQEHHLMINKSKSKSKSKSFYTYTFSSHSIKNIYTVIFRSLDKKKKKKTFFPKKIIFWNIFSQIFPSPPKVFWGPMGPVCGLGGPGDPWVMDLWTPPKKKILGKKVFLILINHSRWGPRQAYSGLPEVHLASGIAQGGMKAPISTICEAHPPKKTFWIKLFPNSPPIGL